MPRVGFEFAFFGKFRGIYLRSHVLCTARPVPNFDCCFRFHPTGDEHQLSIQAVSRQLHRGSKETVKILVTGLAKMPVKAYYALTHKSFDIRF